MALLNATGTPRQADGAVHLEIHLFVDKFLTYELIISETEEYMSGLCLRAYVWTVEGLLVGPTVRVASVN